MDCPRRMGAAAVVGAAVMGAVALVEATGADSEAATLAVEDSAGVTLVAATSVADRWEADTSAEVTSEALQAWAEVLAVRPAE